MKDMIDPKLITVLNSPPIEQFTLDASITRISIRANDTEFDFDAKDRWQSFQAEWAKPGELLQVTLWGFEVINGQWFGSGIIQRWAGAYTTGDSPASYQRDWFYAGDRWGVMSQKTLLPGMQFGYMLTNSDARNNGTSGYKFRSNIVAITLPTGTEDFTFANTEEPKPPVLITPPNQDPVLEYLSSINYYLSEIDKKLAPA